MIRRAGETADLVVDGEVERAVHVTERDGAVASLLDRARPRAGADHATVHSADGLYRASIPLTDLRRGALTAGRLTIPDGRTHCWDVKDVARIEVTTGPRPDSVPEKPPH